jgi:4-hydroxy-tetrahydrodipicolinate reductase
MADTTVAAAPAQDQDNLRAPYRVIVWGPGGVGKAALKIMHDRPEFELVGVLCHSFGKGGVDVGQYIAKEPTGLQMSRDKDAVLGLDADIVLYTGSFAMDQEAADQDMRQILESGKNLISVTSYNYPHYHGEEYVAKFEEACRKGNSSMHGSGEMPGFFLDRVALTMTGVCKEVHHLKIEEWFSTSQYQVATLGFFGVNKTKEEAREGVKIIEPLLTASYAEALTLICRSLWDATPDVSFDADFELAKEMIELPRGTVAKGKVADLHFIFTASIDGVPRLEAHLNWTFTKPERWVIEIEGDPVSLRTDITGFASLKDESLFRPGDTTRVSHYCTAMPLVQAIPMVVEAPPGIVYPTVFTNAMPDMRRLATRKTIAG